MVLYRGVDEQRPHNSRRYRRRLRKSTVGVRTAIRGGHGNIADPGTDPRPDRRVLTRVKKTDVPDGGGKGGVALIFRRIPCNPVG